MYRNPVDIHWSFIVYIGILQNAYKQGPYGIAIGYTVQRNPMGISQFGPFLQNPRIEFGRLVETLSGDLAY